MAEKPYGTRLPLRSATVLSPLSLRTKNPTRRACRGHDDAQILEAALGHAVVHLHGVGDAELGLAAADHGNDHLVARGRLHQHVEGGLLLEHLGDRRRGGVVERRGLQRGEAVGLRRCRGCSERQRRAGRDGDRRPAPSFTDSARHAIPLLCLVRWRASAGILACRPPQGEAELVASTGRLPHPEEQTRRSLAPARRLEGWTMMSGAATFVRPSFETGPSGPPQRTRSSK